MFFVQRLTQLFIQHFVRHFIRRFIRYGLAVPAFILLTACGEPSQLAKAQQTSEKATQSPVLQVYKRESCGCCKKWLDHIENQGFSSSVTNHNALSAFKIDKGIVPRYHSCHTAISEQGYVFEGHIPAKFISQFLSERVKSTTKSDNVLGLAVPGMPLGSPGMEVGEQFMPYEILLLKADGSSEVYVKVNSYQEQF